MEHLHQPPSISSRLFSQCWAFCEQNQCFRWVYEQLAVKWSLCWESLGKWRDFLSHVKCTDLKVEKILQKPKQSLTSTTSQLPNRKEDSRRAILVVTYIRMCRTIEERCLPVCHHHDDESVSQVSISRYSSMTQPKTMHLTWMLVFNHLCIWPVFIQLRRTNFIIYMIWSEPYHD